MGLNIAAACTAILPASISPARAWETSLRLPDPAIRTLDPSFESCINTLSAVERISTGFEWVEGPVWFGSSSMLLFSDVRGNRIMKWDPITKETSVFRADSHFSNGNTVDREGRLITCEGETRRITRTEHDGTITTLVDNFKGKPFNSPNDIICKSDGTIWFTDPAFGPNLAEGALPPTQPANIYCFDPKTKALDAAIEGVPGPNGLCFSPDEKILYVIASRHKPNRQIWSYTVDSSNKVSNQKLFVDCGNGTADGFRADIQGNLWCGWGSGPGLDGVAIFNPAGKHIGHIDLPERCPNLCFGGVHRNELYMASHTSVYKLVLKMQGAPQINI